MNDIMHSCLLQAVQERSKKRLGKPMNEHQLDIMMEASLRMKADGFVAQTLWRALEIATDE